MPVLNKYHFRNRPPEGSINIMRGSRFGSPFVIGPDGDRAEVIAKYREWLWERIRTDPVFASLVKWLHGRQLVCCCAPAACHGDVLEAAAKWLADGGDPAKGG